MEVLPGSRSKITNLQANTRQGNKLNKSIHNEHLSKVEKREKRAKEGNRSKGEGVKGQSIVCLEGWGTGGRKGKDNNSTE